MSCGCPCCDHSAHTTVVMPPLATTEVHRLDSRKVAEATAKVELLTDRPHPPYFPGDEPTSA